MNAVLLALLGSALARDPGPPQGRASLVADITPPPGFEVGEIEVTWNGRTYWKGTSSEELFASRLAPGIHEIVLKATLLRGRKRKPVPIEHVVTIEQDRHTAHDLQLAFDGATWQVVAHRRSVASPRYTADHARVQARALQLRLDGIERCRQISRAARRPGGNLRFPPPPLPFLDQPCGQARCG